MKKAGIALGGLVITVLLGYFIYDVSFQNDVKKQGETFLRNWQIRQDPASPKLGFGEEGDMELIVQAIDKEVEAPLRLAATQPTADAVLNISPNFVDSGDGGKRSTSPSEDTLKSFIASTINFQTGATTGGTVLVEGAAFALPNIPVGEFVRMVLVYNSATNTIDTKFDGGGIFEVDVTDAGVLFASLDGLQIGYVDLESTAANAFKTAASSTNIIENAKIVRFSSGSGGGSGGDTSFKCQSVSDPSVLLKNGFMGLGDGTELYLATDTSFDLDVILGSSPANGTSYYLYADLNDVPAAAILANGRLVRTVSTDSHLYVSTQSPDQLLKSRYVQICHIKSADAGTVWSGTGSEFSTLATKKHLGEIPIISPVRYSLTKQAIGSVGSVGQVKAGHVLDDASFPAFTTEVSYWNLDDVNDGSSNARNLTNNGTMVFTGTDILGTASSTAVFDGSDDFLSSTSADFGLGDADQSFGVWFKATDYTSTVQSIIGQFDTSDADRSILLQLTALGELAIYTTLDGISSTSSLSSALGLADGTWHHFMAIYTAADNTTRAFVDGVVVVTHDAGGGIFTPVSPVFAIGALPNGATPVAGDMDEAFFTQSALSDLEIKKLYSYRLDHNVNLDVEQQGWAGSYFDSNDEIINELDQGWMISKTANSVYMYLGLATTDSISLRMLSHALSTTVIPVKTFSTGILSSLPSFPISHGLGAIPKDFYVLTEGSSLAGDWDKRLDLCSVDSTQIQCDLSPLTIDGTHRIEIVASAAPIAVSVPVVSESNSGVLSTFDDVKSGNLTVTDGTSFVEINDTGVIEINHAANPFIDFRIGATPDYDGRIFLDGAQSFLLLTGGNVANNIALKLEADQDVLIENGDLYLNKESPSILVHENILITNEVAGSTVDAPAYIEAKGDIQLTLDADNATPATGSRNFRILGAGDERLLNLDANSGILIIDKSRNVFNEDTVAGIGLSIKHNGGSDFGAALFIESVSNAIDGPKIEFRKDYNSTNPVDKRWAIGIDEGTSVQGGDEFSITEDFNHGVGYGTDRFKITPGGEAELSVRDDNTCGIGTLCTGLNANGAVNIGTGTSGAPNNTTGCRGGANLDTIQWARTGNVVNGGLKLSCITATSGDNFQVEIDLPAGADSSFSNIGHAQGFWRCDSGGFGGYSGHLQAQTGAFNKLRLIGSITATGNHGCWVIFSYRIL